MIKRVFGWAAYVVAAFLLFFPEFIRAIFYDQIIGYLKPYLSNLTVDHLIHYGPPAFLIIVGTVLFYLTGKPRAARQATTTKRNEWGPAFEVLNYIQEKVPRVIGEDRLQTVSRALRQAAVSQRVAMRGRKQLASNNRFRDRTSFSEVHTEISPEYWAKHIINAFAFSPDFIKDYHTQPESYSGWDEPNHYADLQIKWADVLKEWPS